MSHVFTLRRIVPAVLPAALLVWLTAGPAVAQPSPTQAQATPAHPLTLAIGLAEQAATAAARIADYQAIFTKREVARGTMFASQMEMKFRPRPFSVYLRFINPEHVGREVLFCDGRYDNKLLGHEAGIKSIVGTMALDPNGDMALAEARYPVTRIGIELMAAGVVAQWKTELAYAETEVKYYPEAKLGERAVLVIESAHPVPRAQFPFALTRLWIDKENGLPVRVQQYEFPSVPGGQPVLVEDYTYTNIVPNAALTDADFDRRNTAYRF